MEIILQNLQTNFNALILEMNEQHYDKIRFASYRTACKIRFIQKKTNLYLIDLFNTIEIIRENNLQKLQDINGEITVHQLYQMTHLLFLQLNKRLPRSKNVDITSSITSLLSFMIFANDVNQDGKINFFFVKVVLCTLCSGKFQEKLKYIFSQIIDPLTGNMMITKFCLFLKSLLQLACTVNESQFYQYDEQVAKTIFHTTLLPSLDLKAFIRLFYSSSGPPPILSWFVIMHKMAQVEFVIHPMVCNCCNQENFTGFRYKCQKCFNYNLCQNCFWQGKSSNSHNAETHSCKEYINYKSTSKQFTNSLRKTLRLKTSSKHKMDLNDDLTSFLKINNNFQTNNCEQNCQSPFRIQDSYDECSSNISYENPDYAEYIDENQSNYTMPDENFFYFNETDPRIMNIHLNPQLTSQLVLSQSPQNLIHPVLEQNNSGWEFQDQPMNFLKDLNFELDDEHRLIAHYAANLNTRTNFNESLNNFNKAHSLTIDSHLNDNLIDEFLSDQQLAESVLNYETKNRELMMEIMQLKDLSPSSDYNSLVNSSSKNLGFYSESPVLSIQSQQEAVALEELCYLRERKNKLEDQLKNLLSSKQELKNQLQHTIKLSENFSSLCSAPSSLNSTLKKKEAKNYNSISNSLKNESFEREKMFVETQKLLKEEIYQKNLNVNNSRVMIEDQDFDLNQNLNHLKKDENLVHLKQIKSEKINKKEHSLEEKELLKGFDRILRIENSLNNSNSSLANKSDNHDKSLVSIESKKFQQEKIETLLKENQNKILENKYILESSLNEKNFSDLTDENVEIIKRRDKNIIDKSTNIQNGLNEETIHNNIMNRDIDSLLKKQELNTTKDKNKRINKYELAYNKRKEIMENNLTKPKNDELVSKFVFKKNNESRLVSKFNNPNSQETDKIPRIMNESSFEEISEANNSQTNSISSNSNYLKFDIKSQPLMSFSSIAYVNANRLLNSNSSLVHQISNPSSSAAKLMSLGNSTTSSNDLPLYKMDSLDDSSLDTAKIQDMFNASTTTTDDEEIRESLQSEDTDDCSTLVNEDVLPNIL